jgi:glucose/arabinose dehydrogenase
MTINRLALVAFIACATPVQAQTALLTRVYASGFALPVSFVQDPTDATVQFVVEQAGRIRTIQNGTVLSDDFLDLTGVVLLGPERGLLGMVFAPDYIFSSRFYVNFTDLAGNTVIARFRRSAANRLMADVDSRFDLRWGGPGAPTFIAQPFPNHNGGHLAFGPDGFLYIGLGDGGSGNDPGHRAQNPSELLGKMLRIDVNVPDSNVSGYIVPATNPFVGVIGVRPEIWSFGWRNPWRYSFDDISRGGTGALIVGDVGQSAWEEIDYEPAGRGGGNYGWRNREGAHDNLLSPDPAFLPLVDPIHEYDHSVGGAVTGGYVYRGRALGPTYQGRYFFADFYGRVWSLRLTLDPLTGEATGSNLVEHTTALGGSAHLGGVSSFGVDASAELYVVSYSGKILKITSAMPLPAGVGDFDGDRKADITAYRPSTGNWWTLKSNSSYINWSVREWGTEGDIPVPGDYDGDARVDLAVYRPSVSTWYVLFSQTNYATWRALAWGASSSLPVPGDYDGDGRTDLAQYRASGGMWSILQSNTNYNTSREHQWGTAGDIPVAGDYDGDGRADPAVYRPSAGIWYILLSGSSYATWMAHQWGISSDIPVPGDYDGDGRSDPAIYRPSTGVWWVLKSSTNYSAWMAHEWGVSSDTPVPADYDGDLKTDFAVFRPSTGVWWILRSGTNYTAWNLYQWGIATDIPIP